MVEFLQSYGALIFVGAMVLLMFFSHSRGHGMDCGMGGGSHDEEKHNQEKPAEGNKEEMEGKEENKETVPERRSSGCH